MYSSSENRRSFVGSPSKRKGSLEVIAKDEKFVGKKVKKGGWGEIKGSQI
ncbi:hypothetical protein [Desertivirga brevis]|nr:hypothetical protein [Pedobacter sp. SYSU D00873]